LQTTLSAKKLGFDKDEGDEENLRCWKIDQGVGLRHVGRRGYFKPNRRMLRGVYEGKEGTTVTVKGGGGETVKFLQLKKKRPMSQGVESKKYANQGPRRGLKDKPS